MNNWVSDLIAVVISKISPSVRQAVKDFILELEVKAKKTPNPMDDVLVALLKIIFDV